MKMKTKKINTLILASAMIFLGACKKDNPDPVVPDPVDPVTNLDCNGVDNGTSILDDCGVCQQAYIYNVVSHQVTLLDDTAGVVVSDPMDMVIMPNDPMNPYWNASCIVAPENYDFTHVGAMGPASTVSYGGQTTRLMMAKQLTDALKNGTHDLSQLQQMWTTGTGFDNGIDNADKILRSKTSASPTASATVKDQLDNMLVNYSDEVLANWSGDASNTSGGEYTTSSQGRTVHINAKGMEIDQCFAKALIGGLCFDQSVNKYLSVSVVGADNTDRTDHYTEMEHKWDEGFGYVYGMVEDNTTGDLSTDALLGKYLNKSGFETEKAAVWEAFKLGRAAIVGNDDNIRDEQTPIIKANLSKVIAAKAVGYLQSSADLLASEGGVSADYFHALSEGWGFILSLQYTDWFTNSDVNAMLTQLEADNGFWSRDATELDAMADAILAVTGSLD